jgi:hypothetical protein
MHYTKMHSRGFGIVGGLRNFAFHLEVKVSVKLGYVFLRLRL